jgi:hypothetical protein
MHDLVHGVQDNNIVKHRPMAKTLKIQLSTPNPSLVHQFRNFGEDVYRALRDECEVSIQEIDASTSEFHVRGIHKRELRTTAAKVRKLADKSQMSELINVSEVPDDQTA